MSEIIPAKDFENLREQLSRMRTDRDRLRLITQAATSFKFTCDLVADLVSVAHYGEVLSLCRCVFLLWKSRLLFPSLLGLQ
jgi:hypothetical protein